MQQIPSMTNSPPKTSTRFIWWIKKSFAFCSPLHEIGISHPFRGTPDSSTTGDWKQARIADFFFWPLQPLPLFILAKNIHQCSWYSSTSTAWLASDPCHPQAWQTCYQASPSTEPSAVSLPPAAHHRRLAGRYYRISRTLLPGPATPLSYPGFHSQPHSWWWNFNSSRKPTCVTVTSLDRGHTYLCLRGPEDRPG